LANAKNNRIVDGFRKEACQELIGDFVHWILNLFWNLFGRILGPSYYILDGLLSPPGGIHWLLGNSGVHTGFGGNFDIDGGLDVQGTN